jgi:hypothetical protein
VWGDNVSTGKRWNLGVGYPEEGRKNVVSTGWTTVVPPILLYNQNLCSFSIYTMDVCFKVFC